MYQELDNKIVITNNEYKKHVLLNSNTMLLNIKFYTFEELIKHYYFDYDNKTIYYLMKKYNLLYENAKMYIDNMYFVENKVYNNKLDLIVKYKNELIENNLLIFDNIFREYIKNKDIVIYKYDIDKYKLNIINQLKKITNVTIINKKFNNYSHLSYEFNTIEEEVEYVANKICQLLENKVNISNIKLANINDSYIYDIKRIFSFYNIPINLPSSSIYGTNIVKEFLEGYSNSKKETINNISKYQNTDIYNSIIDICNKYYFENDFENVKELVINDLKQTKINTPKISNAVEIIDYKNDLIKDEYVFLMNFNLGQIPIIYKDSEYITDELCNILNMDTTISKNKFEKELTINSINNIKNLTITYKLKTPTKVYYPSNLIEIYKPSTTDININYSYSKINDKIKLASYLDDLIKYGKKTNNLITLFNNYQIPYMQYNNKYQNINKEELYQYLDNKLTLSYTSLTNYNECAFKFYLSNILKLNIYEENFSAILGTIFHHILEIGLKDDIDVAKEIEKFINEEYKDKKFSNMELNFIDKTKDDMIFVLDSIKQQMKYCSLSNIENEKKVEIEINKKIKINFVGKIDKILYDKDDIYTYVAIIDYKTGYPDIDLSYIPYGLHMQLPIYMYLSYNMEMDNVKIVGIYLQKLMPKIEKIDFNKEPNTTKINSLKLEGYSNNNQNIIEKLDNNYQNSKVIKGLKVKNDGNFYSTAKILSDSQIEKLIKITENKINECIDNIIDTKFDINPHQEGNDKEVTACKYCKYQDICFKTPKDVIKIKPDENLEYLKLDGGE